MNQEMRKRVRYLVIALLILPIWIGAGYLIIRRLDQPYRSIFAPMLGAMAGGTLVFMAMRAFAPRDLDESPGDDTQNSADDS